LKLSQGNKSAETESRVGIAMSRACGGNRSTVAPVCSGSSMTCRGAGSGWRRRRTGLLHLALLGCWCYKNVAGALAFMYEPKANWSPLLRVVPGYSTVHSRKQFAYATVLSLCMVATCTSIGSLHHLFLVLTLSLSLSHSLSQIWLQHARRASLLSLLLKFAFSCRHAFHTHVHSPCPSEHTALSFLF
jgi:hypothetical protein